MHLRHLITPALTLSLIACGDKNTSNDTAADCGEHGDWNADHGHCHCDDDYQLTADGMDCEAEDSGGNDTDTAGSLDTDSDGDSFVPDSVEGTVYPDDGPVWLLLAKEGETWLSIENYPSFGGATGPATHEIDTAEIDYATCGICLLLQTGCEPHGDHSHCEATFMPEVGGEVTFDALGAAAGEQWAGSLSDIHFVEVEINGNTYETTPVTDGATFTLDSWTFDVVLGE